jgi:hypothetical protein
VTNSPCVIIFVWILLIVIRRKFIYGIPMHTVRANPSIFRRSNFKDELVAVIHESAGKGAVILLQELVLGVREISLLAANGRHTVSENTGDYLCENLLHSLCSA